MTDMPPDHVCNNPASPFYDEGALQRGIGIRYNGIEKTTVEEYCVSEGWVRVTVGNPLTQKLNGTVEAYYREPST